MTSVFCKKRSEGYDSLLGCNPKDGHWSSCRGLLRAPTPLSVPPPFALLVVVELVPVDGPVAVRHGWLPHDGEGFRV